MRSKRVLHGLISKMPQNVMSRQMGKVTSSRISRLAIETYIKHYKIDVSEIEKPVKEYGSLKEFFTRRLKPGKRPVDQAQEAIVSPVDGTVSQLGKIQQGTLIQAKGKTYTVSELLADDQQMAEKYFGGSFITIYLSPRDYHRIHMPVAGTLYRYSYSPGKLYPVNSMGVENVDSLFARNERLITYVDNEICGDVAVVKVGALFVGSVKVNYNTTTTNVKRGKLISEDISQPPVYEKGAEIGWFEFGSTVILLFEKEVTWVPELQIGSTLRMGQRIGTTINNE
ncbi:archaetidylserine decarboxylase [Brevibacillus daliensis]|uniref:archaetidylserine decarboxylase n=1 Tax=Brevibacillus daliensis TaxID=2892995 RepID=UPI001E551981|nr:archaetidylserine decarboxylase [Brevibacillus daliensis]